VRHKCGATAQVAGGVPQCARGDKAKLDELSLFRADVIAFGGAAFHCRTSSFDGRDLLGVLPPDQMSRLLDRPSGHSGFHCGCFSEAMIADCPMTEKAKVRNVCTGRSGRAV